MSWSDALPESAHILRRLIDAASPNPPGDCEAVSRVCVELLEHDVSDVHILRAPDGTPNVLASIGHGTKTLLIHSHYDTQPAGDLTRWESDPYCATLRDGAIYGRGAGDDKGSVAAQIAALLTLARAGFDPPFRLQFAFVADEESGGERGTRFLRESGALHADAVVIGEQTDNQVAIGERGIVWLRVEFAGRAAHGAIPEAGVSALVPAAALIDRLHRSLAPAAPAATADPVAAFLVHQHWSLCGGGRCLHRTELRNHRDRPPHRAGRRSRRVRSGNRDRSGSGASAVSRCYRQHCLLPGVRGVPDPARQPAGAVLTGALSPRLAAPSL